MNVSKITWVLVATVSIFEIVNWTISAIKNRHNSPCHCHALHHIPVIQIGKEWEEIYEPGDNTPLDRTQEYEYDNVD